jgi:uncharacterized membrane protein YphA (DoxX/SURF4 family)
MSSDPSVPSTLALGAQFCLAVTLGAAGVGKLRDAAGFRRALTDYRVLPAPAIPWIAQAMPWVELAVALALFFGYLPRLAATAALALLAAFSLAAVANLRRGRRVACGCHSPGGTGTIGAGMLARNIALALLAAFALANAQSGTGVPALFGSAAGFKPDAGRWMTAALLAGFCLIVIPLVEWAVDIHLRFTPAAAAVRRTT